MIPSGRASAIIHKNILNVNEKMQTFKQFHIKEALDYHIKNGIPLAQNIFRPHSECYYELFAYARSVKESLENLDSFDRMLLDTEIGTLGVYEGMEVPLDHPLVEEEKIELDEPKRGGRKKFYVYVKNDEGKIIKVEFGDTTGLKAKINNPAARASFAARHQCDKKTDKTKAGYWSCRLPYYAKQLGLKGGGNFYW